MIVMLLLLPETRGRAIASLEPEALGRPGVRSQLAGSDAAGTARGGEQTVLYASAGATRRGQNCV
jgi:hypothetical protein